MKQPILSIEILDEEHIDDFCIYKLWLGCYFYVGSTTNPLKRIEAHTKSVYKCMEYGHKYGNNAITNMANLLLLYPTIKTAYFEVLETCISEEALVDTEYKHLQEVYGDKYCLNVSKSSVRKIGDTLYRPLKFKGYPISCDRVTYKPYTEDIVFMRMLTRSLKNLNLI